jgi:hypothetical protein
MLKEKWIEALRTEAGQAQVLTLILALLRLERGLEARGLDREAIDQALALADPPGKPGLVRDLMVPARRLKALGVDAERELPRLLPESRLVAQNSPESPEVAREEDGVMWQLIARQSRKDGLWYIADSFNNCLQSPEQGLSDEEALAFVTPDPQGRAEPDLVDRLPSGDLTPKVAPMTPEDFYLYLMAKARGRREQQVILDAILYSGGSEWHELAEPLARRRPWIRATADVREAARLIIEKH